MLLINSKKKGHDVNLREVLSSADFYSEDQEDSAVK